MLPTTLHCLSRLWSPTHPPHLCHCYGLVGLQVPHLASLVTGGGEELGAVRVPAAAEDRGTVCLLSLHTALATLIELPASDLEEAGHGGGVPG